MTDEQHKLLASQLRQPHGEEGIETGNWMNHGNAIINRETIHALSLVDGDKILEIGMGNGFFVPEILDHGPNITYSGCDFSEIMVKEAITKNKHHIENNRASFVLGDLEKLPYQNGQFNKAFTINTLYFWNQPSTCLAEFHRVLTPDGKLLISIRPKDQMISMPFTKYGFNMYSKEEVCTLLRNNRFEVQSCIENDEPPFTLNGKEIIMKMLIVIATKA